MNLTPTKILKRTKCILEYQAAFTKDPRCKTKCILSDVDSSLANTSPRLSGGMYKMEPALEFIQIGMKYEPARQQVLALDNKK